MHDTGKYAVVESSAGLAAEGATALTSMVSAAAAAILVATAF